MSYVSLFLEEICRNGEYTCTNVDGILVLLPKKENSYFMPNIVIDDILEFEQVLKEYILAIRQSGLTYYKVGGQHTIKDYLFYLVKSLTNEDCMDFIDYIRRITAFIKDKTFYELRYIKKIGEIGPCELLARKCEEFYGSETPFTMHLYLETPRLRFELPLVRYGIDDKKIAYIYSVQRKKLYKDRVMKEMKGLINGVNRGVKIDRNVTPAMLCSLAAFMGLLAVEGITDIRADGFLTRRYGYFNGLKEESERDGVLENSLDKFFKLFLRLDAQFDGLDITAFPFDIDSYLHFRIRDDAASSNEVLEELYEAGKSFRLTKRTEDK